jgi:quercetin dioxygenase-like cupin family protein
MIDTTPESSGSSSGIPADDPRRRLTFADPDDPRLPHIAQAGGIYTILVAGAETAGRYCLIEMLVPDRGGPPPHRHDFEEMFTLLDGELEFTFRGESSIVRAGSTVNIPANAPHSFRNISGKMARMLCMCTPAGQEEYFLEVGDPVASRASRPPALSDEEKAERARKALALAGKYRTEFLQP